MERRTGGEPSNVLAQARAAFDRCAWDDAYTRLAAAAALGSLDAEDLQRLAQSAYLTGRDEAAELGWARAHQAFLDPGAPKRVITPRPAPLRCPGTSPRRPPAGRLPRGRGPAIHRH